MAPSWSKGQRRALQELRQVERESQGVFCVEDTQECDAWLVIETSLECAGFERAPGGLKLHKRERLCLIVQADFPYECPSIAFRHTEFADCPHVQWRRWICLYLAPDREWVPSDGMFGFLERLRRWLRDAALGDLDPVGAPIHPPVTYTAESQVALVARSNTPVVKDKPWYGYVEIDKRSNQRFDLQTWLPIGTSQSATLLGATVLLPRPGSFEFPQRVVDLLRAVVDLGASEEKVFSLLQSAVRQNGVKHPLFMIVGTPQRGIVGGAEPSQHLMVWHIPELVRTALQAHNFRKRLSPDTLEWANEIIHKWQAGAPVEWCRVYEDRPETCTRRDQGKELPGAVGGRAVAVWGCGALGSSTAEFLARAGVRKLILRDKGVVTPGLLSRQLYDNRDIDHPKTLALRRRLDRIRPGTMEIDSVCGNVVKHELTGSSWFEDVDLVVDTTASMIVSAKIESARLSVPFEKRPPIASLAIGPVAEVGLVVLVGPHYSGGIDDTLRKAKLLALSRSDLTHYLDAFWPIDSEHAFIPEPGCSEPTFLGSAADVSILTGSMLNALARDYLTGLSNKASVHFVAQPAACAKLGVSPDVHETFAADELIADPKCGYEIRLASAARMQLEDHISDSAHHRGVNIETGGLLLGQWDEAAGVIWVSKATGPPPDSEFGTNRFVCGVEGVHEFLESEQKRSRHALAFIGSWHTHPTSSSEPSGRDRGAARKLLTYPGTGLRKILMMILGRPDTNFEIGAHVFKRDEIVQG